MIWRLGMMLLSLAFGADVRLFERPGVPVSDYANRVAALQSGDRVFFSGGESFEVDQVLGKGSHTVVVSLRGPDGESSDRALRLARYSGAHPIQRNTTYQDLLDGFLPTQQLLESRGVQVVRAFPEESKRGEYVMVESLPVEFLYSEFLNGRGRAQGLTPQARRQALEDFVPFGISLWGFRTVGDQNPEQIAYVRGRGWVYFDFNNNGSTASRIPDGSPFQVDYSMVMAGQHAVHNGEMFGGADERLPLPKEKDIRLAVLDGIQARRREAGFPDGVCREFLKRLRGWWSRR